jgi:alanine racemase
MNLLTWASKRRFPYEPLIRVEINRNALIHNINEFRKLAPKDHHGHAQIAPVLKSNAYGHGLIEVAHALQHEHHIPFFIVDSYFEAIALRAKGIKNHLLVIGYTRPETIRDSNLSNVSFTVTNMETLRIIAVQKIERWASNEGHLGFRSLNLRFRPKVVHIHLKIDTGMHRQGILPNEIDEAINLLKHDGAGKRPVILEGIVSHLCDADNADETFSESQIHVWNKIVERFQHEFKSLKYIHLSATDGHRLTPDITANVSRLGIGLYGISQNTALSSRVNLLPALEMKTIITGIKKLSVGETIGYGNTFKATQDMTIATIPVGYFEGVDRRLSRSNISSALANDGGVVLVGIKRIPCPIIGRVSMNITNIDVSKIAEDLAKGGVRVGDEVTVISNVSGDENSIVNIAKKCATISYEIAVHIPAHLKRIVIG